MSLFKTLQSQPATISIFHNAKLPLSNKLYNLLRLAYNKQIQLPEQPQFEIDVMKDKMPTYDQYLIFVNQCLKDNHSKTSLHKCYPFLSDRRKHYYESLGHSVTIKGIDFHDKIFTPEEYEMIHDTFNSIQELGDTQRDVLPSEVFKAPLVIDWDQNLIATDEVALRKLLEKYLPSHSHEQHPQYPQQHQHATTPA